MFFLSNAHVELQTVVHQGHGMTGAAGSLAAVALLQGTAGALHLLAQPPRQGCYCGNARLLPPRTCLCSHVAPQQKKCSHYMQQSLTEDISTS